MSYSASAPAPGLVASEAQDFRNNAPDPATVTAGASALGCAYVEGSLPLQTHPGAICCMHAGHGASCLASCAAESLGCGAALGVGFCYSCGWAAVLRRNKARDEDRERKAHEARHGYRMSCKARAELRSESSKDGTVVVETGEEIVVAWEGDDLNNFPVPKELRQRSSSASRSTTS
mmetsp:Transcript_8767/g.21318  ORF Transcript_8767/g.21318 Transcript_8767/m.21318 type:complete len:176 (-) Transcript_8767:635-1162(-)|eukprot:CAMPEP_0178998868 /NCGR_PEP_ID=MMETSP0795-20121207/9740_1 /TAXON_ID=88552 /ORGANISM="Amoebophrya sp., Strain Ameob2" /LENGTH=175 /DNA_ID=CAMNT_0020691571 /DNA_START=104 /DNA_END=631 /DNA_ORIENTATION=+